MSAAIKGRRKYRRTESCKAKSLYRLKNKSETWYISNRYNNNKFSTVEDEVARGFPPSWNCFCREIKLVSRKESIFSVFDSGIYILYSFLPLGIMKKEVSTTQLVSNVSHSYHTFKKYFGEKIFVRWLIQKWSYKKLISLMSID